MKTEILAFSCVILFSNCSDYKLSGMNTIEGNGKIIEKTISISDITKIENTGIFNVYIKQGEQQEVKIETDENILPYLLYKIKSNSISFSMKEGKQNYKPTKANIYIIIKDVEDISNAGVGDVTIENVNCKNKLTFNNAGVGNIELKNFNASEINIKNSGVGSVELQGKVSKLSIHNSGVGSIDSYNMQAETVYLVNSGVGSVKVYAEKELSIVQSGVGSVRYNGNAVIKKLDTSGTGSVKKVDN